MGFIVRIIAGFIGFILFLLILFYLRYLRPLHSGPPSITIKNTLLNSHPKSLLKRRGLRHRHFSDDELQLDEGEDTITFTLISKPNPWKIKGCLKQRHLLAGNSGVKDGGETSEGSIDSDSVFTDDEPTTSPKKSVRLLEPSKILLEALRDYSSGTEGEVGCNGIGIGGYRRTRDFYGSKGRTSKERISSVDSSTTSSTSLHISTSSLPSSPSRSSPRLHSPAHSRQHSPSSSLSHPSSLSRLSSLRPRTGSPLPSISSDHVNRTASPSPTFRTSSPLGIRRRRTGSNASLSNHSSNSNSSHIISVSERSTPRWIHAKNVVALEESPTFVERKKGINRNEESDDDDEQDRHYEDVSGASSPIQDSSFSIGDMTLDNFPIPPSSNLILAPSVES